MTDADPTSGHDASAGDADPFYGFKSSVAGSPFMLWLRRDGMEWSYGNRSGLVRYDRIRRVRLAYRPATLQQHRFTAEIWSEGVPKLQIISTSWQGLVQQLRQDGPYAAFITELHRRMGAACSKARFQAGMAIVPYWIGLAIIAASAVAFATVVFKAVELSEWRALVVIVLVFAAFGWQIGSYFFRNRPGGYRPDAIPPYVLPKT